MAAVTAVFLAAIAVPAGAEAPLTADDLLAMLAQHPQSRARFVETRHLAILDQPLVSRGTLTFETPDRLLKQTTDPIRENLSLADNRLIVERPDEGARRSFDLQQHPALWALLEAFRATLAGDRAGLERFYGVAVTGSARAWQLTLTPIQPEVRKRVTAIVMAGAGADITRMEMQETGGDRSSIAITPEPR